MNNAVSIGEQVTLACISTGAKGDGVFRHGSGLVIFAEGAIPGQIYTLDIYRVVDKCAFARVVENEQ